MMKKLLATVALSSLLSFSAFAQDAASVISNASRAMGVDNLDSITFYGSGANFNLGQNNNANGPWPRVNLNDFRRTIDFTRPALRTTAVTVAVPVTGGAAAPTPFNQNFTPDNTAWGQHLEIWTSPWGFLKGAAANNATRDARTVDGVRYQVVTWEAPQKAPSGVAYRVVGYINANTNLVDKVDTWVENPVFGDLMVETSYTNYRDNNGLKYPMTIVQSRAGWPAFEVQILGADANPANLAALMAPPPPAPGGGPPPGPPPPISSEQLADGVYRITGGYVALAVEFDDHIFMFEPAGQNETRSQEVMAEAKRVIPNKPIRYGVLSHHHFDHTSGLPAVVAEGVTIVTHEVNKEFFENALAQPRTLAPDAMSRSGKEAVIETVGDMRVFTDGTRTVEVHNIKGLPHADGMLIAYLPDLGIVAYADMFNLPPATNPVPNPPVVGTMVMAENLERLGLNWSRLVSVHPPAPDRPITREDVLNSLSPSHPSCDLPALRGRLPGCGR
jgi:glyoxylase-like metal-dependent hydrolase (beta-lactamase superfamily II)